MNARKFENNMAKHFASQEDALAAEHLLARAFGCIGPDGKRWTRTYWEAAEELVNSGDLGDVALRNAARVLTLSQRHPWERVAIASRILRGRAAQLEVLPGGKS